MKKLTTVFAALVAVQHIYFLILEMFLFQTEMGMRTFHVTPEQAAIMATMAKNQGLYNGFLAAGLIWSFFLAGVNQRQTRIFFFSCVLIAGVYGGMTANIKILFLQGIPGMLGLVFSYLAKEQD